MIKTYFKQQIKEKFGFQPTFQQEKVLESLSNFLFSSEDGQVFVLNGYAGTGKTTLVSAMVKVLIEKKQKVMLLAPTGRAAKVFSNNADYPAYTIHRRIYREKNMSSTGGDFDLNFNKYPHTVFIVDEASMIANSGLSGNAFGSGRLLDDLLSFVYQGEHCKLILIGDTAQLPPVGESESPALSISYLKRYGLHVHFSELTQVVRQSSASGILYNATQIRQLIQNNSCVDFPSIQFEGFADICIVPGNELIESLNNSYCWAGEDDTIIICRSNKRANIYNNGIRNQVLDREDILCSGDRIIIAKNNYYWTEKIKEIDFIAKRRDEEIQIQATVKLPDEVSDTLMERTNPTWPCTWFAPRMTGKYPFTSAYDVMNNWGANHGAISYGHIGADLITLCSILRIPVCMHNVPEQDVYRPASWNAFGMDKEGADYRACEAYGPMYKNIRK